MPVSLPVEEGLRRMNSLPILLMLLLLLWASAVIKFYFILVRNWSLRSCCTAGNSSQGEAAVLLTQGSGRLAAPVTENCVFLSSRTWGFAGRLHPWHPLDVTRVCTTLRKSFRLRAFASEYWLLILGCEQGKERANTVRRHFCQSCEAVLENQCNSWSLTF